MIKLIPNAMGVLLSAHSSRVALLLGFSEAVHAGVSFYTGGNGWIATVVALASFAGALGRVLDQPGNTVLHPEASDGSPAAPPAA